MSYKNELQEEQVKLLHEDFDKIFMKANTEKEKEFILKQLDLTIENCNNLTSKYLKNKDFDYQQQFTNEYKKTVKELNYDINYKIELPRRNNNKYTKIEDYKDYEFTHCIAYEMAIRNEEVIKLTKLLEKLNILINYILYCSNIDKIEGIIAHLIKIKMDKNSNFSIDELKSIIDSFTSESLNEIHFNSISTSFNNIINKYGNDYLCNIINTYYKKEFYDYTQKYEEYILENLFIKASNIDKNTIIYLLHLCVYTKLENDYYMINKKRSITPKWIKKTLKRDTNHEPNEAIDNHIYNLFMDSNYKENHIHDNNKGYISYQGKHEDNDNFSINETIPNFRQPLRMFNTMKISINPSLPLNDILSFVKTIKEDYDNENSFKSFFELTTGNLIDSDEKTTIDSASSYNKEKWADMFYIYDYFQFYLSEDNKINKGKRIFDKVNKEDDLTTIAKEISLQLSYFHILKNKTFLDFSESLNIDHYDSAYDKYEVELFDQIQSKIIEDKEYEKYIKIKEDKEKLINFYMSANHIKTDYYPKIKKLIEGENPEYKKLVAGKNHEINSLISGKNNVSSKL